MKVECFKPYTVSIEFELNGNRNWYRLCYPINIGHYHSKSRVLFFKTKLQAIKFIEHFDQITDYYIESFDRICCLVYVDYLDCYISSNHILEVLDV